EKPLEFIKAFENKQEMLRQEIIQARRKLDRVVIPDKMLEIVVRACIALNVDGHRPDIVNIRAAKTLTALEGKSQVTIEDVVRVSGMAMGFRTRRGGFEEPATLEEIDDVFKIIIDQIKETG
ncbi:MAG: hypothetical protein JSV20_07965, partial [Candidatus Bathyarchaeota archaeon]